MANYQVQVEFTTNKRGGRTLHQAGFSYMVKNNYRDTTYWRCCIRDCPATINTRDDIPAKMGHQHNHQPNRFQVEVKKVMNSIKKRCREERKAVPAIYDEEIAHLQTLDWTDDKRRMVEQIPTYPSCKTSLYHSRAKLLPKLPTSVADITLENEWTLTNTGDQFVLFDDNRDNSRILAFATTSNLEILSTATTLYCSRTFYICPRFFSQLYTRFLEKSTMEERQLQLNPTVIFMDAAKSIFQGITVKGCFFHFTQTFYRDNEDIHRLVRRAAVLPLIPPQRIEDYWFNAMDDLEDVDLPVDTTPFTDYVTTQWIEGDRHVWNHFDNDGPRTTNNLEGWHSKLKKRIPHEHPNIYLFIRVLKDIQAANDINRIQRAAGGLPVPKRQRYWNLDDRLIQLKTLLQNDEINFINYGDRATYLLHME
ncbi:uncharacterized protein LOC132545413 [Ylistrum balloti]|uniref:uncharacterized protein LOC132545413 n=1 Tax=Ylistrum balloti TaxID=509963 RepID=UPI0029059B3C|nr:uncharacterized protein LOC132545413 [Ylistrum balloti]